MRKLPQRFAFRNFMPALRIGAYRSSSAALGLSISGIAGFIGSPGVAVGVFILIAFATIVWNGAKPISLR
jgi:nicotinamide mononucleotide (NMN) deamidase PncC